MSDENIPTADESELPKELQSQLKDLPEPQKKAVLAILTGFSIQTRSFFKGPLPHPDILKGYNEVLPDGAERIFSAFEKQSNHRMELEKMVITKQQEQSERGQHYGLIIALAFLLISGFLIYEGHDWAGGILGTVDIGAIVAIFVVGRNQQKKDLEKK